MRSPTTFSPSYLRLALAGAYSLCAVLSSGACSSDNSEPNSYEQKLSMNAEKQLEAAGVIPPTDTKPYVAPTLDLPPPTEEELAAWDRKDPGGEKHLYKWDKRNLARMKDYWHDIICFHDKLVEEGEKMKGAEPGGPEAERWDQFKRAFIPLIDQWQKQFFASEPRILEKSKFIGNFIEAHSIVMNHLPRAYNENDDLELQRHNANWIIVTGKINRYGKQLGGNIEKPDVSKSAAAAKWQKRCEKAMKPSPQALQRLKRRRDP